MTTMLTSVREIIQYRSLLRNLIARDLKVRYKRSLLGIAWTMLNPLLMMLVFTLVFGQILRVPVEHFTVFFLSAYLLWNFFAQTTSWSTILRGWVSRSMPRSGATPTRSPNTWPSPG